MTVEMPTQESYLFQAKVEKAGPQVIGGQGVRVDIKLDGKVQTGVLDAVAGAAVGALGWGDEDVYQIINEAARKSTYSYPALISNESAEELAKFYIENSPQGAFSAALWCTSGSESNENALRIVRQYWIERGFPEKMKIISRENSYHGFTLGAQSISSNPRIDAYCPLLIDQKNVCVKMPCAYTYRFKDAKESEEEYAQRLLNILEEKILENNPEEVGTVIVETLPGSALGTSPPPKGYLKGIRALCNKYDIIFHLDEVMCGTGRCNPNGKLNCWENFLDPCDAPDIQTVGKTLGSGYVTIAGVLVGPKIRRAFLEGSGSIIGGHTYSCHAFNCAVALGIQKKIKEEKLTENVFKMGNLMGKKLKDKLLSTDNIAGDVRGIGGFWTVEFVQDRATKKMFDTSLGVAVRFKELAYKNGITLICMPSVKNNVGDLAIMAPSFIITEEEVDEIVDKMVDTTNELSKLLREEGVW